VTRLQARWLALLALGAVIAGSGCGATPRRRHPRAGTAAAGRATGPRILLPSPSQLNVGLTESNASLLWSPASDQSSGPAPGDSLTPGLGAWRERVTALRPQYVRIDVDWARIQPRRDVPPVWDVPQVGCQRGRRPCLPYRGISDELAAIASQQHALGGFEPLVDIYDAPAWAALPPSGCEQADILPRSRPIAPAAVPAYRTLIRSLLELARRQGVALPYWTPWNEPNHPFFFSPQRARCSTAAPSLAPARYVTLAHAMAAELARAPGSHELVLGELAGIPARGGPHATGIAEFVADLPRDVVCATDLWSVHDYARPGGPPRPDEAAVLERALDARGPCGRRARIWVTETGAGRPRLGAAAITDPALRRAGCRALSRDLRRWSRDPRVQAAFQYTFREDPAFPVGLADAHLTTLYPAYYLWVEWGRAPARSAPHPLPPECA